MGFNFSIFGTQEHRVFNYRPRYYDPEKEALKEKFGHVDGSKTGENYTPGAYIKGSLRNGNYQKSKVMNKNQWLIGLIGIVLFFVALYFFTKIFAALG